MTHVLLIVLALLILAGFLALTNYETRRGARVFARERTVLDEKVSRIEFILEHVDLGAFAREELRRLAHRIAHDTAHVSLAAVRAAERLLTRLVRRLRPHRAEELDLRDNSSAFVKTLSDFKGRLKKAAEEDTNGVE